MLYIVALNLTSSLHATPAPVGGPAFTLSSNKPVLAPFCTEHLITLLKPLVNDVLGEVGLPGLCRAVSQVN